MTIDERIQAEGAPTVRVPGPADVAASAVNARCDAAKADGATVTVSHEYGVYWAKVRSPRRSVMHVAKTFDRALLGALERWESRGRVAS